MRIMAETNLVSIVKLALEMMDKEYCNLSKLYRAEGIIRELPIPEKYLERPFAYEFYHSLRKLVDCGRVDLGDCIMQAEVDKKYQNYFVRGKIPDFLVHKSTSNLRNLAVIEFKLATNYSKFRTDLEKLILFIVDHDLRYLQAIEVIIGTKHKLKRASERIDKLKRYSRYEIIIITFDVDKWKADDYLIKY